MRFDATEALGRRAARRCPPCRRSSATTADLLVYTRDVGATIGALLGLADAKGVEPQNLDDPPGDPRGRLPRPDRSGAARLRRETDARPVGADHREHQELLARPRRGVLDAGVPADLHLHVRVHLPGRRRRDAEGRAGSTRTARPTSTQLRAAFAAASGVELTTGRTAPRPRPPMKDGEVDAIIVVPGRLRRARSTAASGGHAVRRPSLTVFTDPSRSTLVGIGRPGRRERPRRRQPRRPAAARHAAGRRPSRPRTSTFISYFVPSILGLSVMQVGIFAAVPLVADREKRILKRLAATPLRRWQLVGSNVADAAAHRARSRR